MPSVPQNGLPAPRAWARRPAVAVCTVLVLAFAACFVLWPVARVLSYPRLSDFLSFFTTRTWYNALLHSLFLTALGTVSCTLVAFLFAYTVVRTDAPLRGLFRFVTLLPVLSPPFIVALSYIFLFGGQGIVTKQLLHLQVNIYGWQGLWFVQTITFFPFAYTAIEGVLGNLSATLEYAAANLGASRWRIFRDATLPLCLPGIAGGALMAAVDVLTDFGNPAMIGGNYAVLPTEAYMQVVGNYDMPTATMLSAVLLVPSFLLFFFSKASLGRRSYTTVTGRESAMPPAKAAPAVKWLLFAGCLAVSLVVLSVYGVLFYGAFAKLWGYDWSFSLKNFQYVLFAGNQVWNSILFGAGSALAASCCGLLIAWLVVRGRTGLGPLLDFLAVLPAAIPGVFLGLGFALSFNTKPLVLTGTAAILLLALTVWNVPNCYTISRAVLEQIGGSMEEASRNLGAGGARTFFRVLLPLLWQPFLSGFLVAFLRSVTCLSVVIFLYGIHTMVGTISILNFVQNGQWGVAAALTVLLIAAAFLAMGAIRLLQGLQKSPAAGGAPRR